MTIANNQAMLNQLKRDNLKYFTPQNKRFFNDVKYYFMYSGEGDPYLVRSTYAWTDMFNPKDKYLHFRLNELEGNGKYKVGRLLDDEFKTLLDVKKWLKNN